MVPVDIVAKANWPLEKSARWSLSTYEGQFRCVWSSNLDPCSAPTRQLQPTRVFTHGASRQSTRQRSRPTISNRKAPLSARKASLSARKASLSARKARHLLKSRAYSSLQTSKPHPSRTKKWGHVKEEPCERASVTPNESGKNREWEVVTH